MAKDFSGINTGRVYGNIETATSTKGQQGTASPQEQAQRRAEGRTQGRKGCKSKRINFAFTDENYAFIKVMARATGRTMTEFINFVLESYRNEHPELMAQAHEFIDKVNGSAFSAQDSATDRGQE